MEGSAISMGLIGGDSEIAIPGRRDGHSRMGTGPAAVIYAISARSRGRARMRSSLPMSLTGAATPPVILGHGDGS
jgi:hypothetical protein